MAKFTCELELDAPEGLSYQEVLLHIWKAVAPALDQYQTMAGVKFNKGLTLRNPQAMQKAYSRSEDIDG